MVRDEQGAWQAPQFVSLTGGSVGWQAGVQATDVILVFKTQKSIQGLMEGKFTLGVDAAAAAGPVGREATAATDATLKAEIYSYSRSRGLFAGVSLDGSALQIEYEANQSYYRAPPAPSRATTSSTRCSMPSASCPTTPCAITASSSTTAGPSWSPPSRAADSTAGPTSKWSPATK